MPRSISQYYIDPNDLIIVVDNTKFSEVKTLAELTSSANVFYLEEDLSSIVLHKERLDFGSKVSLLIKPQEITFFKREKGYYGLFRNHPDPQKSKIGIKYLSNKTKKYSQVVNKRLEYIRVGRKALVAESVVFITNDSDTFAQVNSKESVGYDNGSDTYSFYVNEEKGIIFVPKINIPSVIKVEYDATPIEYIDDNDYDIWFEDGEPLGILIQEKDFHSEDVTETLQLSAAFPKKFSLKEGIAITKVDHFANNPKVFTLSNDSIVRGTVRVSPVVFGQDSSYKLSPVERQYVDGESEFLDLKKVEFEKTNRIFGDVNGFVSFRLAAGEKYYSELGISIESDQFTSSKNSYNDILAIGDYFVSNDGFVFIKVGVGNSLDNDKNISYHYIENLNDTTYQFSVDYEGGIIYLSEDMVNEGLISYKTSSYVSTYEIVDKIKHFDYNKTLERLEVQGGQLKKDGEIGVAYLVKNITVTLLELKEYFTPFVDRIDFRLK